MHARQHPITPLYCLCLWSSLFILELQLLINAVLCRIDAWLVIKWHSLGSESFISRALAFLFFTQAVCKDLTLSCNSQEPMFQHTASGTRFEWRFAIWLRDLVLSFGDVAAGCMETRRALLFSWRHLAWHRVRDCFIFHSCRHHFFAPGVSSYLE